MSSAPSESPAAEAAAREATRWFVRLNNPDATETDRREFEDWLRQNPLHAHAFRDTHELWHALDAPAKELGTAAWYRKDGGAVRAGRFPYRLLATAALLIISVAGAALWRDAGLIDRAMADHATRPGERRQILLADGTQVYLDGDTAITETLVPDHREMKVLRGRIWLDVAPDPARPFSVIAGKLRTRVLGTSFSVDSSDVTVEHGVVAVSLTGQPDDAVRLRAGEHVSLAGNGLGRPDAVDPEVVKAWRRGLIVLNAAPLGDVADELARMAPGRMIIPDGELRALTLSGVFRTDDPDAVLEAMRTALGLKTVSVPGFATLVYR